MTMNRIQTDRQMKSTVTVIILALCVVFSMLFSYVKDFPLKILLLCTTAVIMLILSFALLGWAVRNQIDRGLKYAWKHYVLVLRLRKELLDAGIYTTRKIGVEKVAVIPWVTVDFAPDFRSGRVYIKNSIQFHDKLAKIDISSALGGYVVEQAYLTDDAEHYYFDFYDARYDKRLVFHNFGEFKAYSDSVGDYG